MTPMRVDQVGSLLRPENLKAAFMRHATNQMPREDLTAAQDAAIRELIAKEEAHGLPVVTDGEYRRLNWQVSFSEVAGWDMWNTSWMNFRQNPGNIAPTETPLHKGEDAVLSFQTPVTEKLRLLRSFPLDEYRFAASVASCAASS